MLNTLFCFAIRWIGPLMCQSWTYIDTWFWRNAPRASFISLLLLEELHVAESIYSSPRSRLLQRRLFSFEAIPRRFVSCEEILAPPHMTKRFYAPWGGCTSLALQVKLPDPSPPRNWIPCLLRPCIPGGSLSLVLHEAYLWVVLPASLVLPNPSRPCLPPRGGCSHSSSLSLS